MLAGSYGSSVHNHGPKSNYPRQGWAKRKQKKSKMNQAHTKKRQWQRKQNTSNCAIGSFDVREWFDADERGLITTMAFSLACR